MELFLVGPRRRDPEGVLALAATFGAVILSPDPADVAARLSAYGRENRRSFPWRQTTDPFRILVAEMLLQRSRGTTVAGVHRLLFERWSSAAELSVADPAEVADVIRPLGLVRRAGYLTSAAGTVARQGPVVFVDESSLRELPGVGRYAARATLGLPVVDGTSARVYRRVFGLLDERPVKTVDEELWQFVEAVTPTAAREWNWSVLDLAAETCLPKAPRCGACPLRSGCTVGMTTLASNETFDSHGEAGL